MLKKVQINFSLRHFLVMASCFVTQYLTMGFAFGSISLLPLYYQERYNERTLSAHIGAVQVAVSLMSGKYLCVYSNLIIVFNVFTATITITVIY